MASELVRNRRREAFKTSLFCKCEPSSSSTSFTSQDSVLLPAKTEICTSEVIRFAQVMFPEFFVKETAKGFATKWSENRRKSSSLVRPGLTNQTNKFTSASNHFNYVAENDSCESEEGIKIWFIKEYGLLRF